MKRYIGWATLALIAMGCNENRESSLVPNPKTIQVTAQLPSTRATLEAFEEGDVIGLFAVERVEGQEQTLQVSGNYLNNEPLTLTDDVWTPQRALYWSSEACDFYGIYPYTEILTTQQQRFDLVTDQSTAKTAEALGGYEANDLMWAKAENISQENGSVNLRFEHMMSRMVVKIVRGPEYEGELPDDITAHIYNTATTAMVNWEKGSLEKYLYSENKTITMRKVANDQFDAIVVPQFIERSTPLVEITLGGIAYLLEYSISLRPGYEHTITVTLNTSPDQEKIEIEIEGDIDNWN